MSRDQMRFVKCGIDLHEVAAESAVQVMLVRPAVAKVIDRTHPDWSSSGYICQAHLKHFTALAVQETLEASRGEITDLEADVLKALHDETTLSQFTHAQFDRQATLGERVADRMAAFGGSWVFISIFVGVMFVWISVNSVGLFRRPFDPFPFILLNLCLSCLAAIQAPVIMMSQNRQEARDRLGSENDYKVNLKAEVEIRLLHEKLDHLLLHQWQRLMEIQQIQTDLLEQITEQPGGDLDTLDGKSG